MKKSADGYLTVYLSLMIGVLLFVIITILEAVRRDTIKMEIESVTEISLFSIFGEYHRELLNQYDLFAIDSGYGRGKGTIEQVENHLRYYMNRNFEKDTGFYQYDLTDLYCDNTQISEYCLLSDENGKVLKEAVLAYMKEGTALGRLEEIKREYSKLSKIDSTSYDLEGEWRKEDTKIQEIIRKRDESWTGEEAPPPLENPADHIKEIKREGALGLALPSGKTISTLKINSDTYISERNIQKGTGKIEKNHNFMDVFVAKSLLSEYFMEKCGNYGKEKEGSYLKYQTEYLLYGKKEDHKNLEEAVEQILLLREGINLTYLMSDEIKKAEAEAAAWAVSMACLMPELKDSLKMVILFAWSYAESIQDIRILLEGEKIPVLKTYESWNTPFSQLLSFTSHLDDYRSSEEGMGYEDYLKFFLSLKNEEQLLMRFMDICEMDIRYKTGNNLFCMDECITELKARSSVRSGYGEGFSISRSWYYE